MSEQLSQKIASRGYWRTVIRPEKFKKDLIRYDRLEAIIRSDRVQLRGWDFPHVWKTEFQYGSDSISQGDEWSYYLEQWQFFQSGLFAFVAANHLDWLDQAHHIGPWKDSMYLGVEPGKAFGVIEAVHRLIDLFEFAARLSLQPEFTASNNIWIDVKIFGLAGRQIYFENVVGGSTGLSYKTAMPQYDSVQMYPRVDLIAHPQELALTVATELFKRFGWDTNGPVLQNYAAVK